MARTPARQELYRGGVGGNVNVGGAGVNFGVLPQISQARDGAGLEGVLKAATEAGGEV